MIYILLHEKTFNTKEKGFNGVAIILSTRLKCWPGRMLSFYLFSSQLTCPEHVMICLLTANIRLACLALHAHCYSITSMFRVQYGAKLETSFANKSGPYQIYIPCPKSQKPPYCILWTKHLGQDVTDLSDLVNDLSKWFDLLIDWLNE